MLRTLLLLLSASPVLAEPLRTQDAAHSMPGFEFRALLSKEVVRYGGPRAAGVQSLDGGPLLVYFWGPATYCRACGQAMTVFESLHRDFALKGLQIVGLGLEIPPDGEKDAEALAGKFSHLIGPYRPNGRTAAEGIGLNNIPSWALVDSRGKVFAKSDVGVDRDYIAGKIREMLQAR
ncbi:MAG: TlpA family protein disulfide reductase [Elusimicrobia bacterium]|nr:TlpA family protein disulfide reductase [Elusimicrobiota bacterium]